MCGLASTGVVVMRQMLRDLSALTWVQTKAVAWLAQCLVAGSIPSWIVLTKLDGTASPECQKSAKKKKPKAHLVSTDGVLHGPDHEGQSLVLEPQRDHLV